MTATDCFDWHSTCREMAEQFKEKMGSLIREDDDVYYCQIRLRELKYVDVRCCFYDGQGRGPLRFFRKIHVRKEEDLKEMDSMFLDLEAIFRQRELGYFT